MIRALRDDLIARKPAGRSGGSKDNAFRPATHLSEQEIDIAELAVMSGNPVVRSLYDQLCVAIRLAHGEDMNYAGRNRRRQHHLANGKRVVMGLPPLPFETGDPE